MILNYLQFILSTEKNTAIEKFQGENGLENQKKVLLRNPCVNGNQQAADFIIKNSEIIAFLRNEKLILQDAHDDDVYFLLFGDVAILRDGRNIAVRLSPNQVGEMAATTPNANRTATVRALSPEVVAAKLSAKKFQELITQYTELKENLYNEMGNRHRQRIESVAAKSGDNRLWQLLALIVSGVVAYCVYTKLPTDDNLIKVSASLIVWVWMYPMILLKHTSFLYDRLLLMIVPAGLFASFSQYGIKHKNAAGETTEVLNAGTQIGATFYFAWFGISIALVLASYFSRKLLR